MKKRQTLTRWANVGLMFFLVAWCYIVWLRPAAGRLQNLQSQISIGRSELTKIESRTQTLPALQSEVDGLAARLQSASRTLPRQADLPEFIRDIGQVCQQSAVHKFDCQPGVVTKADHLSEQKILLTFEGEFLDVFKFLQQAEAMRRLTRVRTLSIKTKDPKLGQVEVRLAMNIYFDAE